jgi:hypothetical protein
MAEATMRRTQPCVCSSAATCRAPASRPSAPKNSMPRPNAAALKTIMRATCGGGTPAAEYSRMRTTPPDKGPSPIVLDKA